MADRSAISEKQTAILEYIKKEIDYILNILLRMDE